MKQIRRQAIEPVTNTNMSNKQDIELLVVQGLNTIYQELSRHGSNPDFVEKVTSAAKEWAKDCYQTD